jgi:hypothetical protein
MLLRCSGGRTAAIFASASMAAFDRDLSANVDTQRMPNITASISVWENINGGIKKPGRST